LVIRKETPRVQQNKGYEREGKRHRDWGTCPLQRKFREKPTSKRVAAYAGPKTLTLGKKAHTGMTPPKHSSHERVRETVHVKNTM